MKSEDQAYEEWRQRKLDREWMTPTVGTVIPFSRTVDKDPNPRIPLSVPVRVPSWKGIAVYLLAAAVIGVATYWWA